MEIVEWGDCLVKELMIVMWFAVIEEEYG